MWNPYSLRKWTHLSLQEWTLSHYSTQSTFTCSHPISSFPFFTKGINFSLELLSIPAISIPSHWLALVLHRYRFQSSCSPKVAVVKVTTLNAVSFDPMDMFQSLSHFPGMSDLHASSSWYAKFTPLASQNSPFAPFLWGLLLLLSPVLADPLLPSHQTLEFLKPQSCAPFFPLSER